MLNKTENNTSINNITPCSIDGLIALTDNKNRTHIFQRELISHTEDASGIEGGKPATTIFFTSGKWMRIFLSGEELAKRLGINIAE
ncbi:cobalamin biosynthesis protein CbiX (plasmid) [Edwardsiella hoshinae]|uniref:hypothetical protein n=1 Tax=Edwardsiella hoshinae TaxID=93378 RepID=UPI000906E3CD|nr:hypothetical protein [Edwardsiella hoshinae]QPR26554.1 cobalamin biosynthesis protein CbiX [Edwardsiella hoshinae]